MPQKLIFLNGIDRAYPKDRSKELHDELVKRALAKQAAVEGGELPDFPPSPQRDLPLPAQPIQDWFARRMMSMGGNYNRASAGIDYMKGLPSLTSREASNLGILANPTGQKE